MFELLRTLFSKKDEPALLKDYTLKRALHTYEKDRSNKQKKYTPSKAQKQSYRNMKRQNIKKGKEYEKFIGRMFEEKGYIVKYNGIEAGKKDSSIDLIAIKGQQIIFTQCKNWKEGSKYKINHEKIKAFIGDTTTFITQNPQYQQYNIKRLFCVANDVFDKSALAYMNSNRNIIEYRIIKQKEAEPA